MDPLSKERIDYKKNEFQNSVIQYLGESKQLACLTKAAEFYKNNLVDDHNKYPYPFRHNVFINFTELAEKSGDLASFLLLEPHLFINIIKEVIHCALFINEINLDAKDVIVNLRINLPAITKLLVSTRFTPLKTETGLFIIRGILIAVTTPYKYVQSMVFQCPIPGCENNELISRIYGESSNDDRRCSVCNISKVEICSARELGNIVIGVIMNCDGYQMGSVKYAKGITVIFKDDLCKDLLLGSCYDVTLCNDSGNLVALGIFQQIPDTKIRLSIGIPFSPIPLSIQNLLSFLSEKCPQSPWALTAALSSQLGSHLVPLNCFLHLKAGILLSLASQGENSQPIHLLCMGSEGRSLINYCSKNLTKRLINAWAFTHAGGVSRLDNESDSIWLEAGPLLMANGGVCYVGEWTVYKVAQSSVAQIKYALENGQVELEIQGNQRLGPNPSSPSYPLQCSIWADYDEKPNVFKNKDKLALRSVTELFGMPFIGSCVTPTEIKDCTTHVLQKSISSMSTNLTMQPDCQFDISEDDLKKYLDIVSSYPVTITQKAKLLLKKYFVATRRSHLGCLPLSSVKIMTALSEAHARIGMRKEVIEEDVMFVIYLYEKSIAYLYGQSLMCNVNLEEPSSKSTIAELVDKNMKIFSEWLINSLKSLVSDESIGGSTADE